MMKKTIFFILFMNVCINIFCQVNFDLVCTLSKIHSEDEKVNVELFDYNYDGLDEIIVSYKQDLLWRIVIYDQNGDTLGVKTKEIPDNQELRKSHLFNFNNSIYLITVMDELLDDGYWEMRHLNLELFDWDTLSLINSSSIEIGTWYSYDGNFFSVNVLKQIEFEDNLHIYLGIDKKFHGWIMDYIEEEESRLYKYSFNGIELVPLEEITNCGSSILKYNSFEKIVSSGRYYDYSTNGNDEWAETNYSIQLLSCQNQASVDLVFNIFGSYYQYCGPGGSGSYYNHYPFSFRLLTKNDSYYSEYGLIIYYTLKNGNPDSTNYEITNNFICFSPDFSDTLWDSNYSELNNYPYISTCINSIDVAPDNHFIMSFSKISSNYPTILEIRNRINGEVVYSEESPIEPFAIIRRLNSQKLFFNSDGVDEINVYQVENEAISVDEQENQIIEKATTLNNFPNPFSNSTTISFCGTTNLHEFLQINIYNIKGQLVREFHPLTSSPSRPVEVIWDGKDEAGKELSPGLYFYKLSINDKTEAVEKCLLVR